MVVVDAIESYQKVVDMSNKEEVDQKRWHMLLFWWCRDIVGFVGDGGASLGVLVVTTIAQWETTHLKNKDYRRKRKKHLIGQWVKELCHHALWARLSNSRVYVDSWEFHRPDSWTQLVDSQKSTSYKNNNKIFINNIPIKYFKNIIKEKSKPWVS